MQAVSRPSTGLVMYNIDKLYDRQIEVNHHNCRVSTLAKYGTLINWSINIIHDNHTSTVITIQWNQFQTELWDETWHKTFIQSIKNMLYRLEQHRIAQSGQWAMFQLDQKIFWRFRFSEMEKTRLPNKEFIKLSHNALSLREILTGYCYLLAPNEIFNRHFQHFSWSV